MNLVANVSTTNSTYDRNIKLRLHKPTFISHYRSHDWIVWEDYNEDIRSPVRAFMATISGEPLSFERIMYVESQSGCCNSYK